MNHWILVAQDMWWCGRWLVPPALLMVAGDYIGRQNAPENIYEDPGFYFFVSGFALYIAAVMGWWL